MKKLVRVGREASIVIEENVRDLPIVSKLKI
jgi:hypothetical protein